MKDRQDKEYLEVERAIASFLSACLPVEKYLQAGTSLTNLQLDTISTAIQGLQTNIVVWKSKAGRAVP
jgi:hypothetical protein